MKNLATLWTDLRRILSTSPGPLCTCLARHEIAIPLHPGFGTKRPAA
jgi:hypothetical protein